MDAGHVFAGEDAGVTAGEDAGVTLCSHPACCRGLEIDE